MDERLSIAPMMEWTDPHYRMLMRGLTKHTVLYSEMVVDDTVIHSPGLNFFIGKNIQEEPSVIQLGGHEPENLARAAELCEQYGGGYGEINLNCGCPSPRVAKRCFGAKLMLEPELVREIVYSMQRRVSIPITVKCRIGADDLDSYDDLTNFIRCASAGGARKFVVHARKCILNGLSPKQNREIPPLHYETVHRLIRDFPELKFVLNGGVGTLQQAHEHMNTETGYTYQMNNAAINMKEDVYQKMVHKNAATCHKRSIFALDNHDQSTAFSAQEPQHSSPMYETLPAVHGVMIGRAAFTNPAIFATADSEFFGVKDPCLTRRQVLDRYIEYCEWCQSDDGPRYTVKGDKEITVTTAVLLNAMRNIMHGLPNVQRFRTALNDVYMDKLRGLNGDPNPSCREVIYGALAVLNEADIDRPLGNPNAMDDVVKTYTSRSVDTTTTSWAVRGASFDHASPRVQRSTSGADSACAVSDRCVTSVAVTE